MIFDLLRLLLFFSGFCIEYKGWEVYLTDVRNPRETFQTKNLENVCCSAIFHKDLEGIVLAGAGFFKDRREN